MFLLTWAYGVTTHSAFAFDMFVKPQLSPALTSFVTWHPLWFVVAVLLSGATLIPVIRHGSAAARVLAVGYVVLLGAIAVWLSGRAYLASLTGGAHNLLVVPGALAPMIWLAVIDHLDRGSSSSAALGRTPGLTSVAGPEGLSLLWVSTSATAVVLWLAHAAWASISTDVSMTGAWWALLFDVALAQLAFLALASVRVISGANRTLEYAIAVLLVAAVTSAVVATRVLPTLGFSSADRFIIAIPFGIAIALMWSGLRVWQGARIDDGMTALLAAAVSRRMAIALTFLTVSMAGLATAQMDTLDWMFVGRQLVAVAEVATIFALMLALARPLRLFTSSAALLVVPASVVLLASAAPRLWAATAGVEQAIAADPLARVAAPIFLARQAPDTAFTRQMLDLPSAPWSRSPAVPEGGATVAMPVASPPHVFVIVLDSLRRDYLSVYNPAVAFTPNIDRWAREAFVFRNAFTPYGGTALAMPALWAGRGVPHAWAQIMSRINRLETLIVKGGFDFLINDHTVREYLRPETPFTFLNPYASSPQTDLCQNVAAMETHIRTRTSRQPLFTFVAPMNLHILNTRVGTGAESYPGFHAPYAAQLERADTCFGELISFLKAQQLYEKSIVVLTSDHGDSLGEGGRWGHQSFLYPEIVRIPLIVSLPAGGRTRVTADVERLALLSDVTPTLVSLISGEALDADLPEGSSLFVEPGRTPRNRESAMLMSSYGPVFGLVNKRHEMYMTDLQNWMERGFALGPVGYRDALVTDAMRHESQTEILREAGRLAAAYGSR